MDLIYNKRSFGI